MGRKSLKSLSIRSLRDEQRLRKDYAELHDATSAWLDGAPPIAVDIALDTIAGSQLVTDPYPTIEPDMTREARMIVFSQQLTAAGQLVTRLERELTAARGRRDEIKGQLMATIAEPAALPDYMVRLCRQIQALGGTQADLQPQSKALAKAMLEAARAHNAARASQPAVEEDDEPYPDEPVSSWSDLPRRFAGIELVEIDEEDAKDIDPCPLPPSTDIAFFTSDRSRPDPHDSRRETYHAWSVIIRDWCERQNKSMPPLHRHIWAMLLAHRIDDDGSDISRSQGLEFQSPWTRNRIARINVLSPPDGARQDLQRSSPDLLGGDDVPH